MHDSELDILMESALIPDGEIIWEKTRKFTMTGAPRVHALTKAVAYICKHHIPGAMVECGVWRGGSVMAMALTLLRNGEDQREIFLYDTFAGMTPPTDVDVSIKGTIARLRYAQTTISELGVDWCLSPLHEVQENLRTTDYPEECVHYIQGEIEDTVPSRMPAAISLLRLDMDWFRSTSHALTHLYPLVLPGGFLIIDDYGHWAGARKAVDEYFEGNPPRPYLKAIDYSCRIGVRRL